MSEAWPQPGCSVYLPVTDIYGLGSVGSNPSLGQLLACLQFTLATCPSLVSGL